MTEFDAQKKIIQKAISDIVVHGNLTVGDITQIINLPQPERFIPEETPANLLTSNTVKFVGREKKLIELHDLLRSRNAVMVTALAGMGGVGKTELATQYAWLYYLTEAYPGGICWVRSRNEDIGLQITGFAREKFGLNIPDALTDPVARVKHCWNRWLAGNVLVVFDDAADYQKIIPYLPQEPRFKVLVTTRLDLDLPKLNLNVLDEDEALQLLGEWIGAAQLAEQKEDGKELALRLGYLPLALNLVGRYVRKRRISLAEMLDRLAKKGLEHPALDVDKNDKTWTLQIERGVKAAFELSWAELSDSAKVLGMLLGIFAQAVIPWELPEKILVSLDQAVEDIEDARLELTNLHLLQQQQNCFLLHQLIREFMQRKLTTPNYQDWRSQLRRKVVMLMVEQSRENIYATLTLQQLKHIEKLIPHLKEVAREYLDLFLDEDHGIMWIHVGLARFYKNQTQYVDTEYWYEKCLEIVTERFGESHIDVATSLNNLADFCRLKGDYHKAEALHLRSLEITVKILGEEDLETAKSTHNLALTYRAQGHFQKAEFYFLRSLSIFERQLDSEHLLIATNLSNLSELYLYRKLYMKARPYVLRSLEIREKKLVKNHPDIAISLNSLGNIYHFQRKYAQAEELLLHSLLILEENFGKEHLYNAAIHVSLGALYTTQKRYSEAESHILNSLLIRQKKLGGSHPDIANSLINLGTIYYSQGNKKKALDSYHQALSILKTSLGNSNPETLTAQKNISRLQRLDSVGGKVFIFLITLPIVPLYLCWQLLRVILQALFSLLRLRI
ncbi:NB-ARC domain protein [[Leptolyngbya] sp. PCC 7376]|uniref:tetratricopeptide repeat protein n=1 Tax=[Leptolyngbya] sp. PCC 7376 TaxID=111781 RepID=UPI00029F443D|nr:tetratricopeptide repeat protein [[Leptolyngbya] sp. PCC 7376]AFY38363.1 NB-ARC domain protein [[Leptolyngbya] sp. PCC 7376]